jgi:imidazolonepropionase-like amidohydrolase
MNTLHRLLFSLLATALCGCHAISPTALPARPTPTYPLATVAPMQGPNLALVNGTLFDGTGADPLPEAVVLISQGLVTSVGPGSTVTVPEGYRVIDVQDGFILPGLINAHVHDGYDESNLQAWAAAGVTTVRDLGRSPPAAASFERRNSLRRDTASARLVAAGPFITVPRGYPIVPWGAGALTVTTVAGARETVIQLIDEGADVIKISLESGGTFERTLPVLSAEEASAIVSEAHARGKRVSAHITGVADVRRCLSAGVDDIAHMPAQPLSAELAVQVARAGVYWVPTLELWHNVHPNAGQVAVANLKLFLESGGLVALGTDFAGYDAEFDLGLPIREMEWMMEAGMTARQVLVAATRNAAVVCGLGRELGTVQSPYIADILVVAGDPLADIHALLDVRWVIHYGEVIRES